jgi:hypothetical protein
MTTIVNTGFTVRTALALAMTLTAPLLAGGKLSRDFDRVRDQDTVGVIVEYKEGIGEKHHERIRRRGGRLKHQLRSINAGAYELSGRALRELENDTDVASISPDYEVSATLD